MINLKQVHEYIWDKFIEHKTTVQDLDDERAHAILQEYYSKHPLESTEEYYFFGILLFEMGYEKEDRKLDYFARAKKILEMYRTKTGEEWDEIDDRIFDIDEFLKDAGILDQVEVVGSSLITSDKGISEVLGEEPPVDVPEDMVHVPEGEFLYGPERVKMNLPAFLIDKYPITNTQYEAYLEATNYRKPKYWKDQRFKNPDQPVVGISFMDARKYAAWAGKELPTEEQWEKAARGTDGRKFAWGNQPPADDIVDFKKDPSTGTVDRIGSHPRNASPFGCFDMNGTVWEWTESTYDHEEMTMVIRGGSWCDDEYYANNDFRLYASPREKADNLGFRCCRKGASRFS